MYKTNTKFENEIETCNMSTSCGSGGGRGGRVRLGQHLWNGDSGLESGTGYGGRCSRDVTDPVAGKGEVLEPVFVEPGVPTSPSSVDGMGNKVPWETIPWSVHEG